jgi:hypothetical protein
MTGKSLRRTSRAARRERIPRPRTPWLVAGAFVASTALGKSDVRAQARFVPIGGRPALTTAGDLPVLRFDIPGGSLREVITAFEDVTEIRIRYTVDEMRLIDSPDAAGVLAAEQALRQILAGTSMAFRFESPHESALQLTGVYHDLLRRWGGALKPPFAEEWKPLLWPAPIRHNEQVLT